MDEFPEPVRKRVTIDGRLMALPLDTHPLVLYYNTDICEKAGLLAPDGTLAPITGADQMLDDVAAEIRTERRDLSARDTDILLRANDQVKVTHGLNDEFGMTNDEINPNDEARTRGVVR